ncbi:MAG: hypothetical protein H6765_04975 [Candidatus Peribacteria bacterium]|nr:MAG: hypothetical protein H6765_04975 [Candidatus Peribacteria bacterium]
MFELLAEFLVTGKPEVHAKLVNSINRNKVLLLECLLLRDKIYQARKSISEPTRKQQHATSLVEMDEAELHDFVKEWLLETEIWERRMGDFHQLCRQIRESIALNDYSFSIFELSLPMEDYQEIVNAYELLVPYDDFVREMLEETLDIDEDTSFGPGDLLLKVIVDGDDKISVYIYQSEYLDEGEYETELLYSAPVEEIYLPDFLQTYGIDSLFVHLHTPDWRMTSDMLNIMENKHEHLDAQTRAE